MSTIGQRIKNKRLEMKLTQAQLSYRLGLKNSAAVTKWENGETKNLKLENLMNLCSVFNCSVEYLIYGDHRKSPENQINDGKHTYTIDTYTIDDKLHNLFENNKVIIDKEYLDVISEVLKIKKERLKQLKIIVTLFIKNEPTQKNITE